jgi:oligoribonuclease
LADWLLWLDTETTGLDPVRDRVIEVACFLTDDRGHRVSDDWHRLLPVTAEAWNRMAGVVRDMHTMNGLLRELTDVGWLRLSRSGWLVSVGAKPVDADEYRQQVDLELAGWVRKQISDGDRVMLAGSSIHFDLEMLRHQMPETFNLLHYRVLDVTSLMLTGHAANGQGVPKHGDSHRAAADIHDSYNYFCQVVDQWGR